MSKSIAEEEGYSRIMGKLDNISYGKPGVTRGALRAVAEWSGMGREAFLAACAVAFDACAATAGKDRKP